MSGVITHLARAEGLANPWRVVAGAVAELTVCNGPVLLFTSGVFLKPIAADMAWACSPVSFALSLSTLLSAVPTPFLGRMMDRWGVRRVALPRLSLFVICPALIGLSPRSLTVFTFLRALTGIVSTVQTPLPYEQGDCGLVHDRCGLALGVAMPGVGWAP